MVPLLEEVRVLPVSFAPRDINSLYLVCNASNRFWDVFKYPSTTCFRAVNSASRSSDSIRSMYRVVIFDSAVTVKISSSRFVNFDRN